MKNINIEVLKTAANRLMFDMSDDEYKTLLEEFEIMIKQMNLIGKISGVDDATPMTFPYEYQTSFLREDEVNNSLTTEEGLKNAAEVVENQIKLPKVVK